MKPEGPELGRKVQPENEQSASKAKTQGSPHQAAGALFNGGFWSFKGRRSESARCTVDKLPPVVVAPKQDHPENKM
jgi:hypothetical protein